MRILPASRHFQLHKCSQPLLFNKSPENKVRVACLDFLVTMALKGSLESLEDMELLGEMDLKAEVVLKE